MTRYPGRDDQGRPIVAELGRAETPDETAARKAENSRRYRGGQTTPALVGALVVTLAIVAVIVMIVVRPDAQPQYSFRVEDYAARTAEAAEQAGAGFVAPVVPADWFVNRAEFGADPGVTSWELSFVTAAPHRITLIQALDANRTWLAEETAAAEDSRVIEAEGLTLVIVGSADEGEIDILADAVAAELAG